MPVENNKIEDDDNEKLVETQVGGNYGDETTDATLEVKNSSKDKLKNSSQNLIAPKPIFIVEKSR